MTLSNCLMSSIYYVLCVCIAMCFVRPNDRHRCYALRKANSRRRLLLRSQKADVSSLSISLASSSILKEGDEKTWELSRKQEEIVSFILCK